MLDPLSLRIALAVVAVSLLVLAYVGSYRRTRSSYSGWWTVSLVASTVSTSLYLLNDTPAQVIANPLGNGIGVVSAACAWGAARSLRGLDTPRAWFLVPAAAATVIALADSPATDVWAGGVALLVGMAAMFVLGGVELARLRRERAATASEDAPQPAAAINALLGTVSVLALFYLARAVLFVAVGPSDPVFENTVGTSVASLVLILALVVVTFTFTELSQYERTRQLRMRATHDSLTGMLNREAFLTRASARLDGSPDRWVVVYADLDHFKSINDVHGHAAGDAALVAFAEAAEAALAPADLVGRLGGEEFAFVLDTDDPDVGRERMRRLSHGYAARVEGEHGSAPTASYGIVVAAPHEDLDQALRRADAAMYRAKRAGRDRAVIEP